MNESNDNAQLSKAQQTEVEAAAFRRLLAHLDSRKDVQNIDLMILAGFCRNCLSKWYREEAEKKGKGAVAFKGKLLDIVSIKQATNIVKMANKIKMEKMK